MTGTTTSATVVRTDHGTTPLRHDLRDDRERRFIVRVRLIHPVALTFLIALGEPFGPPIELDGASGLRVTVAAPDVAGSATLG